MITTDGVVVDGNRRTMLLNRIDKFDYLKIVLQLVQLKIH